MTISEIAPHPPLSPAGRGEGEGASCQKNNCVCISILQESFWFFGLDFLLG